VLAFGLTAFASFAAVDVIGDVVVEEDDGGFSVNGAGVVASFELFGMTVNLTTSVVVQWFLLVVLGLLFWYLGRNLKVKPESKRQMFAEYVVGFFRGMVKDAMGERHLKFAPYIATIFCFSMFSSYSSLLGMRSPTADISVIAAWGILTFVHVQRIKFKTGGTKGFLKGFVEPMAPMLPMNILSEFTNPLSQTFRHFGNIMSGMIIMGLIYSALGMFAVIIPAALSLYFDVFSGFIQAYIFATLTMIYVSVADRTPN
jgi:F-type H+-transporting ATPase subunit a